MTVARNAGKMVAMALIAPFTCSRCHTEREEVVVPDRVCSHCRIDDDVKASLERRMALAALTGLTTDERLARMEATLYDLGTLAARVAALEAYNVTY